MRYRKSGTRQKNAHAARRNVCAIVRAVYVLCTFCFLPLVLLVLRNSLICSHACFTLTFCSFTFCFIPRTKMKKDGDVVRTYKLGRRYTSLKVGTELKELAYKIAETKNDYYSWSQYIEVCDSIDIKDARERLNAFIH